MSVKERAVQLDLFYSEGQMRNILDEEFKKSMLKRVNGLFARYNELEEVFWDLKESVEKIKQHIYK